MERDRGAKIIAATALVFAIVGVSIGFAAFSNDLTITSEAEVTPVNSLRVYFSSSDSTLETNGGNIEISYLPVEETTDYPNFKASTPVISNDIPTAPTLTNLKATFIRPGESVTYKLYVQNASSYDAQLSAITFGTKSCTAKSGTSQNLVDDACGEFDISVTVGGGSGEPTSITKTLNTSPSSSVSGHVLGAGEFETLQITLSYISSGSNTVLNGDFDVKFGDVTLTYSTIAE